MLTTFFFPFAEVDGDGNRNAGKNVMCRALGPARQGVGFEEKERKKTSAAVAVADSGEPVTNDQESGQWLAVE